VGRPEPAVFPERRQWNIWVGYGHIGGQCWTSDPIRLEVVGVWAMEVSKGRCPFLVQVSSLFCGRVREGPDNKNRDSSCREAQEGISR
jgi:hypothetical protein